MNNNIQEDYCSFEVSKLLKEKGFQVSTSRYYTPDGNIVVNFEESHGESEYRFDADDFDDNFNDGRLMTKDNLSCWGCKPSEKFFEPVSLTTHSIAIKWIRDNFRIHITELAECDVDNGWYQCEISIKRKNTDFYEGKNSPYEAIEAALKHTLNNLVD